MVIRARMSRKSTNGFLGIRILLSMCCFRGTKPGNPVSNPSVASAKKANQRVTTVGNKMTRMSNLLASKADLNSRLGLINYGPGYRTEFLEDTCHSAPPVRDLSLTSQNSRGGWAANSTVNRRDLTDRVSSCIKGQRLQKSTGNKDGF